MTTQLDTSIVSLSTSDLLVVTGGAAPAGDYGSNYTHTVHKDLLETGAHEHAAVNAFQKHNYGTAAKEGVRALASDIHTITDAAQPVKDLINIFK